MKYRIRALIGLIMTIVGGLLCINAFDLEFITGLLVGFIGFALFVVGQWTAFIYGFLKQD